MLGQAFAVNPWRPETWSYRAVLAHLRGDTNEENQARETALKYWPTNPKVDHLIGKKLSRKYRFAEGSAYKRRALKFDTGFLPAKSSSRRICFASDRKTKAGGSRRKCTSATAMT